MDTKKRNQLLIDYFTGRACSLRREITREIEKVGGDDMLISRTDLMFWAYFARKKIEVYQSVCRMLEEGAESSVEEKRQREVLEELAEHRTHLQSSISRKREQLDKLQKEVVDMQTEFEIYEDVLTQLDSGNYTRNGCSSF